MSLFETVPYDCHWSLCNYLQIADIINLSQTCNSLRQVYGAESWRYCYVSYSSFLNSPGNVTSDVYQEVANNLFAGPNPRRKKFHAKSKYGKFARLVPFEGLYHLDESYNWIKRKYICMIYINSYIVEPNIDKLSYDSSEIASIFNDTMIYPQLQKVAFTHPLRFDRYVDIDDDYNEDIDGLDIIESFDTIIQSKLNNIFKPIQSWASYTIESSSMEMKSCYSFMKYMEPLFVGISRNLCDLSLSLFEDEFDQEYVRKFREANFQFPSLKKIRMQCISTEGAEACVEFINRHPNLQILGLFFNYRSVNGNLLLPVFLNLFNNLDHPPQTLTLELGPLSSWQEPLYPVFTYRGNEQNLLILKYVTHIIFQNCYGYQVSRFPFHVKVPKIQKLFLFDYNTLDYDNPISNNLKEMEISVPFPTSDGSMFPQFECSLKTLNNLESLKISFWNLYIAAPVYSGSTLSIGTSEPGVGKRFIISAGDLDEDDENSIRIKRPIDEHSIKDAKQFVDSLQWYHSGKKVLITDLLYQHVVSTFKSNLSFVESYNYQTRESLYRKYLIGLMTKNLLSPGHPDSVVEYSKRMLEILTHDPDASSKVLGGDEEYIHGLCTVLDSIPIISFSANHVLLPGIEEINQIFKTRNVGQIADDFSVKPKYNSFHYACWLSVHDTSKLLKSLCDDPMSLRSITIVTPLFVNISSAYLTEPLRRNNIRAKEDLGRGEKRFKGTYELVFCDPLYCYDKDFVDDYVGNNLLKSIEHTVGYDNQKKLTSDDEGLTYKFHLN